MTAPHRLHLPPRLPWLQRVDVVLSGPLGRTVPHLYSSVRYLAGASAWSAGPTAFSTHPGAIGLKVPGEAYVEHAREGEARFEVLSFASARVDAAREALETGAPTRPRAALLAPDHADARPFLALHHALADIGVPDDTLEELATSAVTALVFATSTRAPSRPGAHRAAVARARTLLEQTFPDAVSLDTLAAHARLDKYHLLRAFHAEVGLPPHAWLTHRRVGLAQVLLAQGMPQIEVAQRVGLYDQSQLHRHFKRIVGVTPGAYVRGVRGERRKEGG